jgi:hypothetical protein
MAGDHRMRVGVTRTGLAKFALATSLLVALAIEMRPTAVAAEDRPKLITTVPKNLGECNQIFLKVMESVEDLPPVMLQQFLLATNADHVLNGLCDQGNYAGAADFANRIADAPTGKVNQQPRNPGECFMGACINR